MRSVCALLRCVTIKLPLSVLEMYVVGCAAAAFAVRGTNRITDVWEQVGNNFAVVVAPGVSVRALLFSTLPVLFERPSTNSLIVETKAYISCSWG